MSSTPPRESQANLGWRRTGQHLAQRASRLWLSPADVPGCGRNAVREFEAASQDSYGVLGLDRMKPPVCELAGSKAGRRKRGSVHRNCPSRPGPHAAPGGENSHMKLQNVLVGSSGNFHRVHCAFLLPSNRCPNSTLSRLAGPRQDQCGFLIAGLLRRARPRDSGGRHRSVSAQNGATERGADRLCSPRTCREQPRRQTIAERRSAVLVPWYSHQGVA